jgi:hypothetical protein
MSRWAFAVSMMVSLVTLAAGGARAGDFSLEVHSPRQLQVVQRETKDAGRALVSGAVHASADEVDKIEVRFAGRASDGKQLPDSWTAVAYNPTFRSFFGHVPVPAGGWYKVEVRASRSDKPISPSVTIDKVGVGEVFVIAGQSNSTNSGEFKTKQSSGMVSSFSGTSWQVANDPQPGTSDNSTGGSPWPAFGDAMYARYKVPIGIASTGFGGTSVKQWQPGEGLFTNTTRRIHQLGPGGFRALLWHQGESDVAMTTDDYVRLLTIVIKESKRQAGWEFPWFVAKVSYHNPDKPKHENMRDAHQRIWDLGLALPGPDTDTLTGDNRDHEGKGIHFSPKGLKAHGEMWADKVGEYLDKVLASDQAGR